MKKIILLILILMFTLSLGACESEKYHKYETLINLLENEDYDAAIEEMNQIIPAPPVPVYYTQEITLDNWSTYFELTSEEDWSINGFGEAEGYRLIHQFTVKEEYLHRINEANVNISLELSYTANYHKASVNLATREVKIGKIVTNISGRPTGEVRDVFDINSISDTSLIPKNAISTSLIQWDDGRQNMYVIEDTPIVTRIQGSIQLLEE